MCVNVKKLTVLVPFVIGALRTVSKRFHMYLKKAGLDGSNQSTITGNIKDYKKGDGYLR